MGRAHSDLTLTSPSFKTLEAMPKKHAQEGENISPALNWSKVPEGTRSFALISHDPDAPRISKDSYGVSHWVLYNIPGEVTSLAEGSKDYTSGLNEAGEEGYRGPNPPEGHGKHHYYFWLLAIDRELNLEPGLTLWELCEQVEPYVIGMNRLVGTYER